MINEQKLFIRSNQTLTDIIGQIDEDRLDQRLPDEMSWRPSQTIRAAMNIYAYENSCVPDVLDGKEKQPSDDEFDGDLLGDDPHANYPRYSDAANRAARELTDPNRVVHISYGDLPASQYLRDISIQQGLGAYDMAKAIHADTKLPDDLVQGLWESIVPIAGYLRSVGVFRSEVDVPASAPLQDRLLGLTGRQP